MRSLFFYILALFASVFTNASAPLCAQEALRISPRGKVEVRFENQVTYLLDKESRFLSDPQRVLAQEFTQHIARKSLNMGYADATLWVRFRLVVEDKGTPRLVLSMKESTLQRVSLYQVVDGQLKPEAIGGASVPPEQRSVHSLGLHLMLETPPPGVHDYVLGIQSVGGILDASFTLQVGPVWVTERLTPTLVFQGVFYGLLFALMISNALTWFLTRQHVHLYFVAYVGSTLAVLANFEGILDWLMPWPAIGGWVYLAPIFSSLVAVTLFLMLKCFYEADQRFPRVARIFHVMIALNIIPIIFNLLGYSRLANQSINAQLIPATIIVVATGWYVWQKGFRSALYMILSQLALLSMTAVLMLKLYNLLPSNIFTDYSFHVGVLLEMVIVYFGLAHRMKNLEAEKDVAQKNERLATVRLDWFNTLVRVMTHDMSTPISVISTSVDLELRRQQPSNSLIRNLERIQRAVNQQFDLVAHVREMIAVTTGKKTLNRMRIDLHETVDGLLLNFAEKIEAKQLVVQVEKASEPIHVLAEATALEHTILGNFMSNAIKFSQKSGTIRIKIARDQDQAVIRFDDQGIGIPAELIEKLFDPTKATSRPGTANETGTGFGLPIALVYVEQFQGTVKVLSQVASQPGDPSGTTFEIRFPLLTAAAADPVSRAS
ncbi:MAG TPA: sensor histidine kinase [Oligoflexus sp.]|uniref:sensor histidine kinase n=1 Tax=Oligoflexus sp. TaxID=1971216 RepID=UPI002D74A68A|nr:sensor histidine kinase [Oligoflexus sp.]HYX35835.1 sensor histidine kinase [Oligoflexus sp.]